MSSATILTALCVRRNSARVGDPPYGCNSQPQPSQESQSPAISLPLVLRIRPELRGECSTSGLRAWRTKARMLSPAPLHLWVDLLSGQNLWGLEFGRSLLDTVQECRSPPTRASPIASFRHSDRTVRRQGGRSGLRNRNLTNWSRKPGRQKRCELVPRDGSAVASPNLRVE
jgi:hypothetical protein